MTIALNIIAMLCTFDGVLNLTGATAGVGSICAGRLFAILARIAQARKQHAEVVKLLKQG